LIFECSAKEPAVDFALDAEQELLVASVRRFAESKVLAQAALAERHGKHVDELWLGLAELGVLDPIALGPLELTLVVRELARFDAALGLQVGTHLVAARGIAAVEAELLSSDDAGAGAVRAALVGHARPAERGQLPRVDARGKLSGVWAPTWGGVGAAVLGVFALRGDEVVFGALAPRAPAVQVDPVEVLAFAASGPAIVRFAGAELRGIRHASLADSGLVDLVSAAVAVGVGRAALEAGRAYALERKQFGQPIAEFQAIQWKLADSATLVEAADLMTLAAATRATRGDAKGPAAQAMVLAGEAAMRAADESLQIHGGYGYTREFVIERLYREAKLCTQLFGTSEAGRLALGRAALSDARA
jgi:alkylation response protein AidB-like acyl-CoA dehydrogenase